ncbi:hypothetical protein ACFE04_020300 [Oxalis oulophora]
MPPPSHLILNGLALSQFHKFIPKNWKQPIEPQEIHNSLHVSMIDLLFTPLKHFANQGDLSKTFQFFSSIQRHAYAPNCSRSIIVHPIAYLLSCCTKVKSFPHGQQLHAHIITYGLEKHPILVPELVTFYTSFSLFKDADIIVRNSNSLLPRPWNILISSYVRNNLCEEALSRYNQMKSNGVLPDDFTYPCVLKACGKMMDQNLANEIHKSIEAFELYQKMEDLRIDINIITVNTVAGVCSKAGQVKVALGLISQLRTKGSRLDAVTINIGLDACSGLGEIKLGKEVHGLAIRSCSHVFDIVENALITMYSTCKDLKHAFIVFHLVQTKSIITWNSMISAFARMDQSKEASSLFRELLLSKIEPNYVTIVSMLPLCARETNLKHCKEFHCYITRREGFKDCLILGNALLVTYARSGNVSEARKLFDMMSDRDKVTYTSLIDGYGKQGDGRTAIRLFDEMNSLGIKPDHVTMIAVLSSCSHSCLVKEGQFYFKKIECKEYGVIPRLEHFSCMVDLYGRAGLLHNAKDMFRKMSQRYNYKPTSAMWATLVGACRIYKNIEIGEWAAERLLETRPENPGYYVLIANMYAAVGCWDKYAKVRLLMRDLGINKDPGRSSVNVGTGFSSFVVEDASNPQAPEVYSMLEGLNDSMKDSGYVANTDSCSEYDFLEEMA